MSRRPPMDRPRHNPSTPEGQIEGAGRFARGLRSRYGWRRWVAVAIGLGVIVVILVDVLIMVLPSTE